MRIIGTLILVLEITSLVLTLKQECKQNNVNYRSIKNRLAHLRYRFTKWAKLQYKLKQLRN